MAITNGYCTLAQLKLRLDIDDTDYDDDPKLESMIEAVSRSIDAECGTRFFTTAADESRYYTAAYSDQLWPGDLLSLTTLKVDEDGDRVYETTWGATDYDLWPYNAALDNMPYSRILTTPEGDYAFPRGLAKAVELTGKFGYCTAANIYTWAPQIVEACLLASERVFQRKDAIFGIVGTPGLGELRHITTKVLKSDSEIAMLLQGFRRNFDAIEVD